MCSPPTLEGVVVVVVVLLQPISEAVSNTNITPSRFGSPPPPLSPSPYASASTRPPPQVSGRYTLQEMAWAHLRGGEVARWQWTTTYHGSTHTKLVGLWVKCYVCHDSQTPQIREQ